MRTSTEMAVARAVGRLSLAWLLLGLVGAGHGEVIGSARNESAQVERKLEAARTRVTVTAEQLSASQSLRAARIALLHACQAAHDSVERVRDDAQKAEALARADAAEAQRIARAAAALLETARSAMERARDRSLDRPMVAYDIAQHGRLTLNALTGACDLSLENGPGITVGAVDIDALLAGRYQLADLDPLTLAAEASGMRHRIATNHAAVRAGLGAMYGPPNVYLLSRRFLDGVTPERLSGDVPGTARLAAGSAQKLQAEAQRLVQLEYEDFATWLHLKGVQELELQFSTIVSDLIRTGSYSRLGLTVKTRQIEYTHRFEPAGVTELPSELLTGSRPKRPDGRTTAWELTEKRTAVAIIWNGPMPARQPFASQLGSDFRLPAPAIGDLRKLLPTTADLTTRRLLEWTTLRGVTAIDTSTGPRRLARATLGPRKEDLASFQGPDCPIIDLRSSDFGEIVSISLGRLAVGNGKSIEVESLELDQSNGRVEAEFTLRHRHVWPSVHEAQAQLGTTVRSLAASLENRADRQPDASCMAARTRCQEAELAAKEAAARSQEADGQLAAAERVSAKRHDLATLTSNLARALTDLQVASDQEARARQEAQTARTEMNELESKVRLSRTNGPDRAPVSAGKLILYGSRESNQRR